MNVCFLYVSVCDYVYTLFLLSNHMFGEPMNCFCQILILCEMLWESTEPGLFSFFLDLYFRIHKITKFVRCSFIDSFLFEMLYFFLSEINVISEESKYFLRVIQKCLLWPQQAFVYFLLRSHVQNEVSLGLTIDLQCSGTWLKASTCERTVVNSGNNQARTGRIRQCFFEVHCSGNSEIGD